MIPKLTITKIGRTLTIIVPIILCLTHVTQALIFLFFNKSFMLVSLIGGSSFVTTIYLFIMSYYFCLCSHYRASLYYMLFVNIFYIIDDLFSFPLTNTQFIVVVLCTFGVSVILFCTLKYLDNKKIRK